MLEFSKNVTRFSIDKAVVLGFLSTCNELKKTFRNSSKITQQRVAHELIFSQLNACLFCIYGSKFKNILTAANSKFYFKIMKQASFNI